MDARIVLASGSPRRAEILSAAGIPFWVRFSSVDERRLEGEGAEDYVRRLAVLKAGAVEIEPGEIILGADTTVVVGGEILEKPRDVADAGRMLRLLSGRVHQVITGVCLRYSGGLVTEAESTEVEFVAMSDAEIDAYAASGEPLDKAGGYAIQGLGSKYIRRIDGCYFNVVGLPVSLVWRLLRTIKI
jgi:septum formation protein